MALLKIRSISDVVTNSSTEVYLFKYIPEMDKVFKGLNSSTIYVFDSEEKIKETFHKFGKWSDGDLDRLNEVFDKYAVDSVCSNARYTVHKEDNLSDDEIWDLYKDTYMNLLGTVYSYGYNGGNCTEEADLEVDILESLNNRYSQKRYMQGINTRVFNLD